MSGETPWWDRETLARRLPYLSERAKIADAVREFFRSRGFVEVETPALQVSPGIEPHLRPFRTEIAEPFDGRRRALYLHTSPEYAMKKLLAAGVERPFQIARVFRNGERSALHHPEFTMLEWYRAHEPYDAIMEDCIALLAAASDAPYRRGGATCDPRAPVERLTVAEAFAREGIDVLATAGDAARLGQEARRIGVDPGATGEWDDVFFKIFLERIEPRLGQGRPTLLTEYPAAMAALARLSPGDPRVAERFELYVCGVELANGFGELTDADEQLRRFEADRAKRRALYGDAGPPIDAELVAALSHMPPASGVALGFDRLVMLATGAVRIEDVLWAPVGGAT
jgi:lysyl-tRNA synthetase class 2